MKLVLATALIALAATASAQEARRAVNPLAIQGRWLGTPGALPTECTVDGYIVLFGTNDGKKFQMGVQPRTGGVAPLNPKNTIYNVIEPPAGAPTRLEIFLEADADGQKLRMGIDQTGGSTLEIVPAGADGAYAQTSLFLRRCS
ncbi:hypothetical protein sos41_43330 [Alphaproteobacteria bacterium SO-S41]|nr:hypothetical protein sos41_43330 [Alphaproteobacteria bacterium SO-S41]